MTLLCLLDQYSLPLTSTGIKTHRTKRIPEVATVRALVTARAVEIEARPPARNVRRSTP